MQFKTSDLPGIGKRHSFITSAGTQMVVITHHHGQRDIYHFKDPDDDEPTLVVELVDEEARQLGAILLGVDYQPVTEDKMQLMLKGIRVEWVPVATCSKLAGQTIRESEIRKKTGVTVIGIKRGEDFIGSPDADERMLPGDILMVIGQRDPVKAVEKMCCGDTDDAR